MADRIAQLAELSREYRLGEILAHFSQSHIRIKFVRCITSLLATALSFLMVSAPLSTAACDLSCWLGAMLPACHASNPLHPGQGHSMSMPSDMDMSGTAMDSANAVDSQTNGQTQIAMSVHTMSNMEMSADGIAQAGERKFGWQHSVKNISPCVHEACSQSSVLASTSTSSASYSPTGRPQQVSQIRNLPSPVYLIEGGTSPPDIPATVSLATALRI